MDSSKKRTDLPYGTGKQMQQMLGIPIDAIRLDEPISKTLLDDARPSRYDVRSPHSLKIAR